MSVIAPTVTAYELHEYREQMDRITSFATRIHIDLMDGVFAPTKSPDIDKLWLPRTIPCDIHIMFQHPARVLEKLLALRPSCIIAQAEANKESVDQLQKSLVGSATRFGISLLAPSDPLDPRYIDYVKQARYVLVFSGKLGYHGGSADMGLLEKVKLIRDINPRAEIGWDGGISIKNIAELESSGVSVFNVGGAIQKAEQPKVAYDNLMKALASSTSAVVS